MTQFVWTNFFNTTLAVALTSSATTITVASTTNLPASIPSGEYLAVVLNDEATRSVFEVVYATAISGANLTVIRGQEGTGALAWNVGDYVRASNTAGVMSSLANINGSTTQTFNVADAATATEAINLGQAQANFAAINGTQSGTFFANSNSAAAEGDIGAYALDHPSAYLYNSASGWGLNSTNQGGEIISFVRSTGVVQVGAGLPVQIAAGVSSSDAVNLGQAQADFAPIAGNAAQEFAVATATGPSDAVPLAQFQGLFAAAHVVTGSRALGTTYTNNTGKPMFVSVQGISTGAGSNLTFFVNGNSAFSFGQQGSADVTSTCGIVPIGATYEAVNTVAGVTLQNWVEIY